MIGQVKTEQVLIEFGDKLKLNIEYDPNRGRLETLTYHDDHFDERMEAVIEEEGDREFTLTGASDKFKDKLGEELELDGASDTGNGKRHSLVSVYHTGDERSLQGYFFR